MFPHNNKKRRKDDTNFIVLLKLYVKSTLATTTPTIAIAVKSSRRTWYLIDSIRHKKKTIMTTWHNAVGSNNKETVTTEQIQLLYILFIIDGIILALPDIVYMYIINTRVQIPLQLISLYYAFTFIPCGSFKLLLAYISNSILITNERTISILTTTNENTTTGTGTSTTTNDTNNYLKQKQKPLSLFGCQLLIHRDVLLSIVLLFNTFCTIGTSLIPSSSIVVSSSLVLASSTVSLLDENRSSTSSEQQQIQHTHHNRFIYSIVLCYFWGFTRNTFQTWVDYLYQWILIDYCCNNDNRNDDNNNNSNHHDSNSSNTTEAATIPNLESTRTTTSTNETTKVNDISVEVLLTKVQSNTIACRSCGCFIAYIFNILLFTYIQSFSNHHHNNNNASNNLQDTTIINDNLVSFTLGITSFLQIVSAILVLYYQIGRSNSNSNNNYKNRDTNNNNFEKDNNNNIKDTGVLHGIDEELNQPLLQQSTFERIQNTKQQQLFGMTRSTDNTMSRNNTISTDSASTTTSNTGSSRANASTPLLSQTSLSSSSSSSNSIATMNMTAGTTIQATADHQTTNNTSCTTTNHEIHTKVISSSTRNGTTKDYCFSSFSLSAKTKLVICVQVGVATLIIRQSIHSIVTITTTNTAHASCTIVLWICDCILLSSIVYVLYFISQSILKHYNSKNSLQNNNGYNVCPTNENENDITNNHCQNSNNNDNDINNYRWNNTYNVGIFLIVRNAIPAASSIIQTYAYTIFETRPSLLQYLSIIDTMINMIASWSYGQIFSSFQSFTSTSKTTTTLSSSLSTSLQYLRCVIIITTIIAAGTSLLDIIFVHIIQKSTTHTTNIVSKIVFIIFLNSITSFTSQWKFLPDIVLATITSVQNDNTNSTAGSAKTPNSSTFSQNGSRNQHGVDSPFEKQTKEDALNFLLLPRTTNDDADDDNFQDDFFNQQSMNQTTTISSATTTQQCLPTYKDPLGHNEDNEIYDSMNSGLVEECDLYINAVTTSTPFKLMTQNIITNRNNDRQQTTRQCNSNPHHHINSGSSNYNSSAQTGIRYSSLISCIDFGGQIGSIVVSVLISYLGTSRDNDWHNIDIFIVICSISMLIPLLFLVILR